jgi:hypothetical protein
MLVSTAGNVHHQGLSPRYLYGDFFGYSNGILQLYKAAFGAYTDAHFAAVGNNNQFKKDLTSAHLKSNFSLI